MSAHAIVIGSSREQKLPSLVLEYTIRKHSSGAVNVIHTYDLKLPDAARPENRSRTGFSFNRFAIPAMMEFKGIAAYLECDQIVFRDIWKLLSIAFEGATVLRPKNQASVLVLDCNRLKWNLHRILTDLDAGKFTYKDLMENTCIEPRANIRNAVPVEWNSLERYIPGKTALLHYTEMNKQPWRKWWAHPLRGLWIGALREAVGSGAITMATIEEEVSRKHVVPQILQEIKKCPA